MIDFEKINKENNGNSKMYRHRQLINMDYEIHILMKQKEDLEGMLKLTKKYLEKYVDNSEYEIAELRQELNKYKEKYEKQTAKR